MKNQEDSIKKAFETWNESTMPTKEQKEKMLNLILEQTRQKESVWDRLHRQINVYPWRFAFAAASVWTVVCTLVLGTKYTNVVLSLFGG